MRGRTELPPGVAVVAVGGYGRAELAPHSDLDIMLLHGRVRDVEQVADRLWYPIWDAGFRLDHSVRTVKGAAALATADLKAALGLLDARLIAGEELLVEKLRHAVAKAWSAHGRAWWPRLAEGVAARAEDPGPVAFLLEPNLKEGHGGLRDLTVLRAIDHVATETADHPAARPGTEAAVDTLFDVRVALQQVSGGGDDRLLLEHQDEVAAALDLDDADALMHAVAVAGRTIAWQVDEALRMLVRPARRSPIPGPIGSEDPLATLLRTAHAVAAGDDSVTGAAWADLAARVPRTEGPWTASMRDDLEGLLGSGRGTVRVFETLDQYDLVGRVLPEWDTVHSRPQRNAFHQFTVDRHLVEAAVEAGRRVRSVGRPDLLLLGAWLHDIGKGSPGDHTDAGVVMVRRIGTRLGLEPEDVDTLVALVEHHLLLPSVATSRDLGDPEVIEMVAQRVGTVERLELLHTLTEADSVATGPTAWSDWKAELVAMLVDRVRDRLQGALPVVGQPVPGVSDEERERARHEPLIVGCGDHVRVIARDEPRLFSRVVGVLATHGLNVRAARADSAGPDIAVSEFDVVTESGRVPDWARFRSDLVAALESRFAIDARLQERSRLHRRWYRPRAATVAEPRVLVDARPSPAASVIEVRAADAVGLLYRVTRGLADLDLDIRHAKVSTLGQDVVDTFTVVDRERTRMDDPAFRAEVERALLAAVTELAVD
ncbi:MAG: ACT domain-containing protein [Acidimicrobiia bacterium]